VKTTGVVEYSFMMKNGSDHKEIVMVSNAGFSSTYCMFVFPAAQMQRYDSL
jgi:hypothetical protein